MQNKPSEFLSGLSSRLKFPLSFQPTTRQPPIFRAAMTYTHGRPLNYYLRSYRRHAHLSQAKLAYLLGASTGVKVSRYESGSRTPPSKPGWLTKPLLAFPSASSSAAGTRRSPIRSQRGGGASKRRKRNGRESALRFGMPSEMPYRILAIDPTSRGFAFAVLEAPAFLVDWGERIVPAKSGGLLRKVDELLARYEPALLVIEDLAAPGSRRRKRASTEIRSIELLALKRGLAVQRVPRLAVTDTFAPANSKFEVALRLAEIFPVLAERLPRKRKTWTTEDARMNIFDALGFAAAAMERNDIARRAYASCSSC